MDTILRSDFWSEGIRSIVKALFDAGIRQLPGSIPWPEGTRHLESQVELPSGVLLDFENEIPTEAPVHWILVLHKDGMIKVHAVFHGFSRHTGHIPSAGERSLGRLTVALAPFLPGDPESHWGTPEEIAAYREVHSAS